MLSVSKSDATKINKYFILFLSFYKKASNKVTEDRLKRFRPNKIFMKIINKVKSITVLEYVGYFNLYQNE